MKPFTFTKATMFQVLKKVEYVLSTLPDTKKVYSIEIKEHREKRSLDANGYCWLLIGKIAEATGVPKTEVYQNAIKEIGGNFEVLPIRKEALESWKRIWQSKGEGWQVTEIGESKLPGFINTMNYYGSSAYDTKQMARLIDNIIQDCEALGIPTETPDQIAKKLSLWGENEKQAE